MTSTSNDTAPTPEQARPASILVVDDNPNNLRVLAGMLEKGGFLVRPALSGKMALRSIEVNRPDLILLDIRMPDMDGYRVCRVLKADPGLADIPVIFISALQDSEDKVDAFRAGGVDYVVKPFQVEEVLARVHTHMELAAVRRALESANHQLELQVEERTRELQVSHDRLLAASRRDQALSELLTLSLRPISLLEYLQQFLQVLGDTLDWRDEPYRSAILVTGEESAAGKLQLVVARGMPEVQLEACEQVAYGECLCGAAARTGKMASCVGGRDCAVRLHPGEPDESCCSLPVLGAEKRVIGVLVQYLPAGLPIEPEQAFLTRVADVLSMGISRLHSDAILEYHAYHDSLTHLPNRRLFSDRLEHEYHRCLRRSEIGAVLFLDLDRFKNINDALGHDVGDGYLEQLAQRLARVLRKEDTLSRWGGDEFLVLMTGLPDRHELALSRISQVAEKLREVCAEPIQIGYDSLQLSVSIGVVLIPLDGGGGNELLRHADTAMYQAKRGGGNGVHFYKAEMQKEAELRLSLEKDLRRALNQRELVLFMQPQVDERGCCFGVEILLRWRHPEHGMVSPAKFIPVAEESGLILPIGEWVLNEAARLAAWWRRQVPEADCLRHISVNVSSRQFHQADFVDSVVRALDDSGLDAHLLELEVTESMVLDDVEDTIDKMNRLRTRGVCFAIDDFGTGYSSLAYLKHLPLDRLKIDQSFVRNVDRDQQDAAIVETILAMAEALRLKVTAEGVENDAELAFLQRAGCRAYQGFRFARPMPEAEFIEWLRQSRAVETGKEI